MRMPPASTSLDIILPPSGKSRGSNQSPDYDEEQIIPGLRYPPSWQQSFASQGASRKLCDSSDDDSFHSVTSCNEEALAGIRYPSSWGHHQSMFPQGASNKILEGSDDSFHSAESHHGTNDYGILSSIDPPKTKIMVSIILHSLSVFVAWVLEQYSVHNCMHK